MAETFFSKFPTIKYSNNTVTDITRRYAVRSTVLNNPNLFYSYNMVDNIHTDQVADNYYKDSRMDWLVYMSSGIVDPYSQWYLQPADFDRMLKKKYATNDIDRLNRRIKYYRNNWYNDEHKSADEYNTMIAQNPILVKYWEPFYQDTPDPLYYRRKQLDWIINTNYVMRYRVTGYPSTHFVEDEIITVSFKDAHNSTGRGQVVMANSSYVTLQHMVGNTIPVVHGTINANSNLTSEVTGKSIRFTSGTLLHNNLTDIEVTYWDPVTYYEYETDLNEQNRSIQLLDSGYVNQVIHEIENYNKKATK